MSSKRIISQPPNNHDETPVPLSEDQTAKALRTLSDASGVFQWLYGLIEKE